MTRKSPLFRQQLVLFESLQPSSVLVSKALLCVFAPLNTGQGVVVDREAAVFTDCLCVNREDLNLMAALRTDLIHDTNLRFALTSFHDHSDCLLN